MTEEQAVTLLCREDSHEAYSYLYDMYWSKVYNFARLYVSSIEDAKEIVQIVFIKLWETRAFLRENESLKGYLFIITRNIIFNQWKKTSMRTFISLLYWKHIRRRISMIAARMKKKCMLWN